MNREIKFKIWDSRENEMINEPHLSIVSGVAERNYDYEILMQYTGLKDKNGKEIYEGDVVKVSKGHPNWVKDNFEIVFNIGAFCLSPIGYDYKNKGGSPTSLILYSDNCEENGLLRDIEKYIEVIGNIYENEELLK